LNEEFGFHINRPFYIISELPFNMMVEMLGTTNVVLRRWRNYGGQKWRFDEKTKTIKNEQWKNYVLHIQGNGSHYNLKTSNVLTSRWW
jgi:hypothetical protein